MLVILIDTKDAQSHDICSEILKSEELARRGVDILVDDRVESAGVKFNDADLVGIPLRVILGPKNLKNGKAEIKVRKTGEVSLVDTPRLISEIIACLDKLV